jgi:translation initiation factor 3 subunit B
MLRSFPLENAPAADKSASSNPTVKIEWPVFKWSFDDKYFAKMTTGAQGAISVYETPGMGLIDKKSIKVENIQAFYWSPCDHTISYWTPEEGNIPARVTLQKVPSREIIRTKNLFNVLGVFPSNSVQTLLAPARRVLGGPSRPCKDQEINSHQS